MVTYADQAALHLTEDRKGQRQVAAALRMATAYARSSEPIGNGPTTPAASCVRMGRGCQPRQ